MIKVSIIIPVYNVEDYLRQSLDSVINQTLREIEIICVDDGSTDGSAAILAEYATNDLRFKILTQENFGQGSARNRGLEVAHGEYVYFMDADDELANMSALDKLVAMAQQENLDVLFFDAETIVDEGAQSSAVHATDYIRQYDYSSVKSGRDLFSEFLKNKEYTVSPCLVIHRRKFLEENNISFPSERIFYEDNIFMTRVLLAAQRASHRPWRFYLRKVHAGSTVTSKPTIRHLRGYLACYRDVCDLLDNGRWERSVMGALSDRKVVFKLNIRRMIDSSPELFNAAKKNLSTDEFVFLQNILDYPLGEKLVNGFRCLRERGVIYTIKRLFFGRQDV